MPSDVRRRCLTTIHSTHIVSSDTFDVPSSTLKYDALYDVVHIYVANYPIIDGSQSVSEPDEKHETNGHTNAIVVNNVLAHGKFDGNEGQPRYSNAVEVVLHSDNVSIATIDDVVYGVAHRTGRIDDGKTIVEHHHAIDEELTTNDVDHDDLLHVEAIVVDDTVWSIVKMSSRDVVAIDDDTTHAMSQ